MKRLRFSLACVVLLIGALIGLVVYYREMRR